MPTAENQPFTHALDHPHDSCRLLSVSHDRRPFFLIVFLIVGLGLDEAASRALTVFCPGRYSGTTFRHRFIIVS